MPAFILATANMAYGSGEEESKVGDYFSNGTAVPVDSVASAAVGGTAFEGYGETPRAAAARRAKASAAVGNAFFGSYTDVADVADVAGVGNPVASAAVGDTALPVESFAAAGEGVVVGNSVASAAAVDPDAETPEQTAIRKARIAKAREEFALRAVANNPTIKIEEYLGASRILQSVPSDKKAEVEAAIRAGMTECIAKFGGKWPGTEPFKIAEQFYWNLPELSPDSIMGLFACANTLNWQDFMAFCDPILVGVNVDYKANNMAYLLPIFQAHPTHEDYAAFMNFCEPYLVRVDANGKAKIMAELLPIFQAYPMPEARAAFMTFCKPLLDITGQTYKSSRIAELLPIFQALSKDGRFAAFVAFCEPYFAGGFGHQKLSGMIELFPIFQAFPTPEDYTTFMAFCEPYLGSMEKYRQRDKMADFLPIFQAFPMPENCAAFMAFCNPLLDGMHSFVKTKSMAMLLPIFQAYPMTADREAFKAFCEPYLVGVDANGKAKIMAELLPIFQAFSKDKKFAKNLIAFMGLHNLNNSKAKFNVTSSFLPRTYLRYMRSAAALQAESGAALSPVRIQALYETDQFNLLPALWRDDPFLAEVLGAAGVADAHDFETLYAQDYATLVSFCTKTGYTGTLSTTPRHTYYTNTEVKDFIDYLDTIVASDTQLSLDGKVIQPARAVSLIKQMLGLEPKAGDTAGGFAHYLGNSMFYKKPQSPKGDELLGRVWYTMKKIGEGKPDADAQDYKKSVVLAILEAAEISDGVTYTNCQTRITGELMKLLAWHLPGSKLRSLIAAQDLPPATTDADISARITFAPIRARQLFATIHREDIGEVCKLRNHHMEEGTDPELWELYKAYYDDLYSRTKIDGVYVFDANTLTRDARGNLVRAHQADGALRPAAAVEIVYHQAEFQVLEMTFTELMRKELEEQRGLMY